MARTSESLSNSSTVTPATPPSSGPSTPSPLLSNHTLFSSEYLLTRPAFKVRFSKSMEPAFASVIGTRLGAPWASVKTGVSPVTGSGSESSAGRSQPPAPSSRGGLAGV